MGVVEAAEGLGSQVGVLLVLEGVRNDLEGLAFWAGEEAVDDFFVFCFCNCAG